MPRFVILRHETPPGYLRPTHYDLMLEQGQVLWTWAMDDLPESGKAVMAERLRDHRPDYLDLQGEVSGERGSVRRVDQGTYELLSRSSSELRLQMTGSRFQGELTLQESADAQRWCVSISSG
jgi:hypothetical protein